MMFRHDLYKKVAMFGFRAFDFAAVVKSRGTNLPNVINRKMVVSEHVITKSFLVFISGAALWSSMRRRLAYIDSIK